MATTWTPERGARQAELIRTWQPGKQSTGPKSAEGKERVATNAWRGGHRAQLRELSALVNAKVRASRELVNSCRQSWLKNEICDAKIPASLSENGTISLLSTPQNRRSS